MQMKLWQQGLVLVCAPIAVMLIFVVVLSLLLEQTQRQYDDALVSNKIVAASNHIGVQFYDACGQMYAYKQTKAPEVLERCQSILNELTEELKVLRELAVRHKHKPAEIGKIETTALRGIELLRAWTQHIAQPKALSFMSYGNLVPELHAVSLQFAEELSAFVRSEKKLYSNSQSLPVESRIVIASCIAFGVLCVMLLGSGLSLYFYRTTAARLSIVMENTLCLTENRPLNPEVGGADEIAELDGVFHTMADALTEAARKESAILENAIDVICSISKDYIISRINQATVSAWEFRSEELIGTSCLSLIMADDVENFRKHLQTVRESTGTNIETRVTTATGRIVYCVWTVRWSDYEQSFFAVAHDVTDQKHIEQLKQDFVAMISHDLRTPMTAMLGLLDLLERDTYGPISDRGKVRIRNNQLGVNRLLSLINGLLDLSKMDAGKLSIDRQQTRISEITDRAGEAVGYLLVQKGLTLNTRVSESLEFSVDGNRIVQVLVNLLGNAIKYSPQNGIIEMRADLNDTNELHLQVSDQGPGIPADQSLAIFDKYSQVRKQDSQTGTGLGLAICKAIVDQHGGKIGVTVQLPTGSIFWFTIPLEQTDNIANQLKQTMNN